jgi:hypothetical protein
MTDSELPQRAGERLDQLLFGTLAGLSATVVLQLIDKEPTLGFRCAKSARRGLLR